MMRSKYSEEQVAYALRQVEAGTPVGDVCRQLGVNEATFYAWKKKYAHLGVPLSSWVRVSNLNFGKFKLNLVHSCNILCRYYQKKCVPKKWIYTYFC
jgi:hypothetical protein